MCSKIECSFVYLIMNILNHFLLCICFKMMERKAETNLWLSDVFSCFLCAVTSERFRKQAS